MDDIGHLEFGELHRPIFFDGVAEVRLRYRTDTLDYWIAYWIMAFRHILRHSNEVVLVSYEKLCQVGVPGLKTIAERLGIPWGQIPDSSAARLRPPRSYSAEDLLADRDLLDEACVLHHQLLAFNIV